MLHLAKLFSDGVVFQHGLPIRIWGWAAPQTMIHAYFSDQTACTRTNGLGKFQIEFPAMNPGGPYQLRVEDDVSSVTVHNILTGEVWLATGQSNMEYPLGAKWAPVKPDVPAEIAQKVSIEQYRHFVENLSVSGRLRFFKVEKHITGCEEEDFPEGNWQVATAGNVENVSAVALWFGHFLQKHFNDAMPVGLIISAWGGTVAEAWSSLVALAGNPETARMAADTRAAFSQEKTWNVPAGEDALSKMQKCCPLLKGNAGQESSWAEINFDDRKWQTMSIPNSWIRQEIAGNGVLWARKRILLPEEAEGSELQLHLGPVDKQDITYFNGVEIGRSGDGLLGTEFWDIPRTYTIPSHLVRRGENVIAIRAYSFISDGGFAGTKGAYRLEFPNCSCPAVPLAGEWKVRTEVDWGYLNLQLPSLPTLYSPHNPNTPGILYGSMIHPLRRFGIRGVIWYQGESNTFTASLASTYAGCLASMISDWRHQWEQGNFPFIQVQLAGYTEPRAYDRHSPWAILRAQQAEVCKRIPNVYLACAIDLGEKDDIHPQNKREVGLRLARTALSNVYHCSDIVSDGPICTDAVPDGSLIRLHFKSAGGGLFLDHANLASFQISADQSNFFPAEKAVIDGEWLILSTPKVSVPTAIRYAWAENPVSALRNAAGLPAYPFHFDIFTNKREVFSQ